MGNLFEGEDQILDGWVEYFSDVLNTEKGKESGAGQAGTKQRRGRWDERKTQNDKI